MRNVSNPVSFAVLQRRRRLKRHSLIATCRNQSYVHFVAPSTHPSFKSRKCQGLSCERRDEFGGCRKDGVSFIYTFGIPRGKGEVTCECV